MKDVSGDDRDATIDELAAVLRGRGAEATRGEPAERVAREWREAGFDDASEVAEWLAARCFEATAARSLDDAGITPEQAAAPTREGTEPYEEAIGYKVANGHLSVEAARRIITHAFWNE